MNATSENSIHYLEIVSPEAEVIRDCYAASFGWEFQTPVPELGNAFVAEMPGSDGGVCGIRPPMHEAETPIVRPYLRVPDLKTAVTQATATGAVVMLESMEIPGRGKIAIISIGGIEQGLWEVS